MKILQIHVRLDSGCVGHIVRNLYSEIKSKGHDCKIAYARGGIGNIPVEDTIKICSELEVKKHALMTRFFGRTAFYSRKSTIDFLKKVDEYNPDVVHIHGVYGYYINMPLLFDYLKSKKIHVVSTLHSCWDFTGHCCYFDFVNCEQWKNCCVKCPQKASYPRSSFLENTKKNYILKKQLYDGLDNCTIATPSKWMENLARQSFLKKHKIVTVPNGIDTNVFKRIPADTLGYGIDRTKPLILCIANVWNKRKGWDDVVELSNFVKKKNVQLLVVGVNDKQKKVLGTKAICISRTTNIQELALIYNAATIFFNPTYEDNYPTVNIESIACGTPVVTYATGGSPEAVERFNMGSIVEKKDFAKLISLAEKYFKLGKAKKNINEELSFKRMSSEYLKVYDFSLKESC